MTAVAADRVGVQWSRPAGVKCNGIRIMKLHKEKNVNVCINNNDD